MSEISDAALTAVRQWAVANRASFSDAGKKRPNDGWSGTLKPLVINRRLVQRAVEQSKLIPRTSYVPSIEMLNIQREWEAAGVVVEVDFDTGGPFGSQKSLHFRV